MSKNVETVKYVEDGVEKVIVVRKPTAKQNAEAQMQSSKVFGRIISDKDENGKSTALLRSKLDDYMRDNGMWDDNKTKELVELGKEIYEGEKKLAAGGIKLSEARSLAINIRACRAKQANLLAQKRELDEYTAEGQAENTKFDTLVSLCLFFEGGERVFSSLDDYQENAHKDHFSAAASKLAEMVYGLDANWQKDLPENKFLTKYGFADESLRLVDPKTKKPVNVAGKLIDDEGRLVDENGKFVDEDGNPVDERGMPVVETAPFLEDA